LRGRTSDDVDRAADGVTRRTLHLIPRWVGGGPERSIVALARKTRALGIEQQHTAAVLDPPLTPTMVVHARRAGIALAVRPDPDRLRDLIATSDVVHVHYWNHPALTTCLRSVELPPARVLLWCHVLGASAPQVFTADVGRYADRVILTSPMSLDTEGARAAADADIPVVVVPAIHDATRLDGFTPRPHDGCVVGYLGGVNAKMHARFAELCAAVASSDVRFDIYGGGGREDALRAEFASLGVANRAHVHGPTEDICAALEGMDIFGYPLAADAYATSEKVLQEAMWVGIPPVVFDHGGPAAMVVDGESGLVVSDERGYVGAIERLASDAELRARLGDGARRRARAEFDPARHVAAVVDLVEALAAQPARTRPPLPGREDRPAAGFVRSLGEQAGPFATSLAGEDVHARDEVDEADLRIAGASALVAHSEGGVVHHRNAAPHDPHLRLWCGLIVAGEGDRALATAEFRAATALGLTDDRPARYEAMLRTDWPHSAMPESETPD